MDKDKLTIAFWGTVVSVMTIGGIIGIVGSIKLIAEEIEMGY